MKYFKKSVPDTPVYIPNGGRINFTKVDNLTGCFATDNSNLISILDDCVKNGRGGVVEIDAQEYEQLKKKDSSNLSKSKWREEIGQSMVQDTIIPRPPSQDVENRAAETVVSDDNATAEQSDKPQRPRTVKRRRARKRSKKSTTNG